jgi:hypothetical protein
MRLEKGTKFRIKNIKPDWYEMGVSEKEYNDRQVKDDGSVFVIDGKLWVFDSKYCKDNEVVELSWNTPKGDDLETIYEIFQGGLDWTESRLFHYYGLLVDSDLEIDVLTEEEYQKTTTKVINIKKYNLINNKKGVQ